MTTFRPRITSPTRNRWLRLLISSAATSVPSSTAPPRIARPIPAPMKNPPKTAVSSLSGVTSGKWTVGQADRQPDDRRGAADRERPADLAVAQGDERQVDDQDQDRERQAEHLGQEHRDAGHAAVDEVARQQEPLQPHPRREDAQDDRARR